MMALNARTPANLQTVALCCAILGTLACEKPVVGQGGKAVVGGVQFEVGDYDIRYLEVSDGKKTYEYPRPALVVPVTVTNQGPDEFTYAASHGTQQMTEAQTPLLYLAPKEGESLPPPTKTMVNGVFLSKGQLEGQVKQNKTLAKGESVNDLLLFEVPDAAQKLILSLPPSLHRERLPVLFKIDFAPREAKGPKVHKVGDAVAFDNATLTVTGSAVAYVKTRDTLQGEGYSSEPLFKVEYEVANKGAEPISYDPAHRAVGVRGAALYGKDATFKRVKFASSTTVDGQMNGTTAIQPNGKIKDFVLFDRPPQGNSELTFEYPAALFGGSGLGRVAISYEYKDPPKPAELTKKP